MRGGAIVLVGLLGCYSPTAPLGLACAPAGSPSRCPVGQVCVSRAGSEVCIPEGMTGDSDAGVDATDPAIDAPATSDAPTDGGPPAGWWDPAWSRRRAIDVTAGSNGAPGGYTVAITLDHAALVSSSASLASGDDVRIVRDSGGLQVDRALDTGAAWNTSTTKLWFQVSAALAPNATVRYWVYYGNPNAGGPPEDPLSVWLYYDGFEGALTSWSFDSGVGVSTARAHRGTKSIMTPAVVTDNRDATLDPIDEMNVAWDLWWNIDDLTDADMSQYVRGNPTSVYLTNLQPPGPGVPSTWDIATVLNGNYSEVIPPPGGAASPPTDTWFRVTVYAYNSTMAVDVGGTRYVPTSGFSNISAMTSGDVGFGTWNSPSNVWYDDATLRRLVVPEPALVVGAQQQWP